VTTMEIFNLCAATFLGLVGGAFGASVIYHNRLTALREELCDGLEPITERDPEPRAVLNDNVKTVRCKR